MSEKEEALNQLNQIHSSLIDNEKFMPYNYNMLVMWGIISAILFLTFEMISTLNIWYAIGYIGIVITFGFLIEVYLIKKENIKYDLEKFTKTQTFIETNYTFSLVFATILTFVFVSNSIGTYAYLSWMFLLGFSNFITGFVLNNKNFTAVGIINISVAMAIFTICMIFDPSLVANVVKYIAVLFSSGGFIYLGISGKKDCEVV